MTALIVQCRLSSTRLPQKALLPLGDCCVLSCVLRNLRQVRAQKFILACDFDSAERLSKIAEREGFALFAGEKDDVLARFCECIKKFRLQNSTIIRATADNPFLFCDSINLLLDEFEKSPCDYLTFRNLPLGAGAEVFRAASLLKAQGLSNSAYEKEHVCPALYDRADKFCIKILDAPKSISAPNLRITIDTESDYRVAKKIFAFLTRQGKIFPFKSADVIYAAKKIRSQILFVPLAKKGFGTGHIARCAELAKKTDGIVFLPKSAQEKPIYKPILALLAKWQFTDEIPAQGEFALIVADLLASEKELSRSLLQCSPVFAIEDSGCLENSADFLADFLPPLSDGRLVNLSDFAFLPQGKKKANPPKRLSDIKKVLVAFGGEDPANFSECAAEIFFSLGFDVTALCRAPIRNQNIRVFPRIENLREKFCEYDLVATHYGLGAFEAASAGCAVMLFCPSALHESLAKKYEFSFVPNPISKEKVKKALESGRIFKKIDAPQKKMTRLLEKIATFSRNFCPSCGETEFSLLDDKAVRRDADSTWKKCSVCGREYLAFGRKTD